MPAQRHHALFAENGTANSKMNRLQKKCFIAVAATHSLLLGILLIGPAFLVKRDNKADNMPVLDFIPTKLVDDAMSSGGGSPASHALPPPPVKEGQPPPPTQV